MGVDSLVVHTSSPRHVHPNHYQAGNVSSQCMIEHLETVVVQLDMKQVTQVHRVHLSLIDVEEQEDSTHKWPAH